MRVWIDLTNSPHVLVMRPIVQLLQREGHEVQVTARRFAQTIELLQRQGIEYEEIGAHRGGRLLAKALGMASRSAQLTRWARGRRFDIALGHGSNDVTIAARMLGIPCSTMFDYEWAQVQHQVNCRLAAAVVVPDAIDPADLMRYGARGKLQRYPGLKEEYYLADFEPSAAVLAELGLSRDRAIVTVRTPPELSLYHRFESDLFGEVLRRLAADVERRGTQVVVLPRTAEQRAQVEREPGLIVPPHAIDAQSLTAFSDLLVSAGGTMNREAVALGRPVLSAFAGRLGAVDARLIAEGRLTLLTGARQLDLDGLASRHAAAANGTPSATIGSPSAAAATRGESPRVASEPLDASPVAAAGLRPRERRDPRALLELLLAPLRRATAAA